MLVRPSDKSSNLLLMKGNALQPSVLEVMVRLWEIFLRVYLSSLRGSTRLYEVTGHP